MRNATTKSCGKYYKLHIYQNLMKTLTYDYKHKH